MKRFICLVIATIAIVAPASAAGASSATPAEYNPNCEQFYQSGKALFDPLINSPLKAVLSPLEKGVCGENKHT